MALVYPDQWKKKEDYTEKEQRQYGFLDGSNKGGSSNTSSSSSTSSKDVFTGVSNTNQQSVAIPSSSQVTYIKNAQGQVIGVNDPIARRSYSVAPTTEAELKKQEQERFSSIQTAKNRQSSSRTTTQAPNQIPNTISGASNVKTNVIDAETQKIIDREAAKEKRLSTPVIRQVELAKEGFISAATYSAIGESPYKRPDEQTRGGVTIQGNQADELSGMVGGFAGLYGNAALKAVGITSGIKVGGAVATKTASFLGAAQKTAVGATAVNIFGATATGVSTFEIAKETERAKLNILTGVGLQGNKQERQAFEAGRLAEKQAITNTGNAGKNIINNVAFDIGLTGNKRAFSQAAAASLQEQGVNDFNSLQRLQNERQATQSATLAATLAIGAFSEQTGQIAVTNRLASGAKPNFWTFARSIAPAGAGEGQAQILTTQLNIGDTRNLFSDRREQNIYGLKVSTTRAEEQALGAAFGATTSGILGGAIGSLAAKGSKFKSGALETLGNVLDPTEKPSDFLQQIIVGGAKTSRSRVTTLTPSFTPVASFTGTPIVSNTFSNSPAQTFISVPVTTDVPTGAKRFTFNDIFATVPVDPTKPKTPTPADVPSNTPTDTDTGTPVNPFSDTPTDTTTNINNFINTPVNVNTNVPVFTDVMKLPPPLPLGLPLGSSGSKGVGKKQRKAYISELAASRQIFNQMVGFSPVAKIRPQPIKSKKKKAKRKDTPASSFQNPVKNFNRMVFG